MSGEEEAAVAAAIAELLSLHKEVSGGCTCGWKHRQVTRMTARNARLHRQHIGEWLAPLVVAMTSALDDYARGVVRDGGHLLTVERGGAIRELTLSPVPPVAGGKA